MERVSEGDAGKVGVFKVRPLKSGNEFGFQSKGNGMLLEAFKQGGEIINPVYPFLHCPQHWSQCPEYNRCQVSTCCVIECCGCD